MGKSKSLYGYSIGATIETQERGADVNIVPDNRTLIALPLNDEPDIEADPTRLKNMKEVFTHYKPKVEVDLKNLEGEADMKELKFSALRDFNKDGIIAQAPVLQQLQQQEETYARYIDIINNNEKLRGILGDPEMKKEFLELVDMLVEELGESNK